MIAQARSEKIFNVFNIFLLGFLALLTVYPFLYTVSISLSTAAEAERNGLHVVPGQVSLVGDGLADMVGLGCGSELPGPEAVHDWRAFVTGLRSPLEAGRPSPTGRIWQRMSQDVRDMLIAAPSQRRRIERENTAAHERLLDGDIKSYVRKKWPSSRFRQAVGAELSRIASDPTLYSPAAWTDVVLDEAIRATLADFRAGQVSDAEVAGLNRRLIESALAFELESAAAGAAWPRVRNWSGLVDRLLWPQKAEAPSVDRRLWGLLSEGIRRQIIDYESIRSDESKVAAFQEAVIRELNGLLKHRDFYDRASWSQTTLTDETLELIETLDKAGLSDDDLVFLNRELLSAAYPTTIARHLRGLAYLREYAAGLSTASYVKVLTNPDIGIGYLNTVMRTVIGTLATLFMTSLAAYPLSRPYMPHKRFFMLFILFTMLFSGGLVPTYMLIKTVGLIDNFWVYVIPTMLSAFNIIVVKNFFQSIPESLAESARIDGASEFATLVRIYIPLSKPVLATVALWTAVAHWNMWFDAMVYIHSCDLQTLQIILRRIVIEGNVELIEKGMIRADKTLFTPETIKAATVIVTILPILLFYPFVQRYFVKGILLGSIKE